MTWLRSHGKLGVSVEISCPRFVVEAANGAILILTPGWRTGTGWGGWGRGEVMGVISCSLSQAGSGQQTRKAIWGEGSKGKAVPPGARCKSTGDWGGALSGKSQREDRFSSGGEKEVATEALDFIEAF